MSLVSSSLEQLSLCHQTDLLPILLSFFIECIIDASQVAAALSEISAMIHLSGELYTTHWGGP